MRVILSTLTMNITQSVYKDIVTESMKSVWQRIPFEFQGNVLSHMIKMCCENNHPRATLLQGTSGESTY